MTTNMTIRIDSDVKKEAEELFSYFGMNLTTAVNVFLRQSIHRQELPFPVSRRRPPPDAEMFAAMEEVEKMLRDPNTPKYSTMEELKKALHE